MTTTMRSSRFGLADMEALLYGPPSSCPMADPMGAPPQLLLHHREQEDEGPPRPRGGAASSSASSLSSSSSLRPPSSSSSSSSSSPPPFYSPSPSPSAPLQLLLHGDEEDKVGPDSDMLSLAWLGHPDQLGRTGTSQAAGMDQDDDENDKEAAFCDLDWMTERMDLSEFDLDTLIGPCSPHDDAPSSPQGLLEALDCPMDLDSLPPLPKASSPQGLLETLDCPMDLDCPVNLDSLPLPAAPADLATASVPTSPPQTPSTETCLSVLSAVDSVSLLDGRGDDYSVPEAQEELEIKSEPVSPAPPPSSSSSTSPSPVHVHSPPPSPTYTLDLGSEVDVAECCEVKPTIVATIVPQQVPRIVLSLSPTRIVLVLAPKREISTTTTTVMTTTVTTRPEVVYSSSPHPRPPDPGPVKSHRSRPYPDPKSRLSPPSPPSTSSSVRVKCPRGGAGATMKEERVAPSPAPTRPVKEKKLKKMEQNKTAATRYRQKKRVEHEQLSVEYGELEKKNIELTEKAESMAREIQYLKELMDEVRLTRMKKGLGADL